MSPTPSTRLRALLCTVAASARLTALEPDRGVDALVHRLRQVPLLPPTLCDPRLFADLVDRLARWLPPYRRMGPCVKRSLLLLQLWSRCGLAPVFHYGLARAPDGSRRAHAWLSGVPADLLAEDGGCGFAEILVLKPDP